MVCASRQLLVITLATVCFAGDATAYRYVHEVLPGESLREIAKHYRVSVVSVKRTNRLRGTRLRAGRNLTIISSLPASTRRKVKYTVRSGDTLSRIAKRFKMKLSLLRRLNQRQGRGMLRPGRWLYVVAETPPPRGGRRTLYRMETGVGFEVRRPNRAWGTFLTVTRLHDVLTAHRNKYPRGRVVQVMDLSQKGGGPLPPHKSHRTGRDVDIRYVLKSSVKEGLVATPARLDFERTFALVRAFIDTGDVEAIFMERPIQRWLYDYGKRQGVAKKWLDKAFQYPARRGGTVVQHSDGHDAHFHVRFRREADKPKPVS